MPAIVITLAAAEAATEAAVEAGVALVLRLAGSLFGRLPGEIPATVMFPGLMQIAPASSERRRCWRRSSPGRPPGRSRSFDVLVVAVQLVLGMLVASVLVRPTRGRGSPRGTAG